MNKVYNNDNARRYVHMALSRQIKSMEAAGMSQEEIQPLDRHPLLQHYSIKSNET